MVDPQTLPLGRHAAAKNRAFPRKTLLHLSALTLALAGIGQSSMFAANGRYTATSGGDWNTPSNWEGGTPADGAGALAELVGSGGVSITLSQPVTLGSLHLDGFVEGGAKWILTNGNLTFDQGSAPGKPTIDLGNSGTLTSTQRLEIGSTIHGSGGLSINGNVLNLTSTANTFTGGIDLNGRLMVSGSGSLNSNTIRFTANRGMLTTGAGNGTYASNLVLAADDVTLVNRASSGAINFSGVISEEGGPRDLVLSQSGVGVTYMRLSGDNSYTGNTTIGRPSNDQWALVVRAENHNAFGQGSATVSFAGGTTKTFTNDAIWLEGGLTIADKKLVLRGAGFQGNGSLRSRNSDNEWAGEVDLGLVAAPTIRVEAETTLLLSGKISGDALGGLIKTGNGTLSLTGDNSHTTGTTIQAGSVLAGHRNAFGGSTGDLSLTGGSDLEVAMGITTEVHDLTLSTGSALTFQFDGSQASALKIFGDQIGSETYTIHIEAGSELPTPGSYTLLTVEGNAAAAGFLLGDAPSIPLGSSLDWNASAGTLTYTVIPEAGTASMMTLGLLAALGSLRRRKGIAVPNR